jgi:hypothetical protein
MGSPLSEMRTSADAEFIRKSGVEKRQFLHGPPGGSLSCWARRIISSVRASSCWHSRTARRSCRFASLIIAAFGSSDFVAMVSRKRAVLTPDGPLWTRIRERGLARCNGPQLFDFGQVPTAAGSFSRLEGEGELAEPFDAIR